MGTNVLAAAAKSGGSFSPTFLIIILIIFVGFYMLLIRPQRKKQQQVQQQQNSVRPGARVTTIGGMRATVVAVDDEAGDVVLEVAPGVEARYMKRAISQVDTPGDEPEETEETEGGFVDESEGETEPETDETVSDESESGEDIAHTGDAEQDAAIAEAAKSSSGQD